MPKANEDAKKAPKLPICVSLSWNALGTRLFAGYTDGDIRVYEIVNKSEWKNC